MDLTEIFPRAMIMDLDRALSISRDTLGIDITQRVNKNYKAFFEFNDNESFLLISEMVKKALTIAMKPFREKYEEENDAKLLKYYHYKKSDLEVIAVYTAIDSLLDQFSLTKKVNAVQKYDEIFPRSDEDINRNEKNIDKLYQQAKKRNENHLIYMGHNNNIRSVVKSNDITYYEFLYRFKEINDFLYNTKKISINKRMVKIFGEAYEYIDSEFGFDKFNLEFRFESDSQIDYMTHMSFILCNLRASKRIDKKTLDKHLCEVSSLRRHRAYKESEYHILASCALKDENVKFIYEEYFMAINEILSGECSNYYKRNNIVFGLYDIYDFYEPLQSKINTIKHWFRELNLVVESAGTCVANIISNILIDNCLKLATERNKPKYRGKYRDNRKERECYHSYINKCIDNIIHSNEAIKYFDNYMEKYNSSGSCRAILNMSKYRSIANCLNKIYLNG